MMHYTLDEHGVVWPEPDWSKWIMWAAEQEEKNRDWRRVALDELPGGGIVSTVFLALDHSWGGGPPVLWETMVFNIRRMGNEQERYTSRHEALLGHTRMVEKAKAVQKQNEEIARMVKEGNT